MATCVGDVDCEIDVGKIPIIDLRSLCQDEIRNVAQLSGDFSEERIHDIVNVAIDKSIFNESLGSRKQTYARDRLPRRAQDLPGWDAQSKPRLPGVSRTSEKETSPVAQTRKCFATDLKEKRSYRENQDLIVRICRQMQGEDQRQLFTTEKPLPGKSNSSLSPPKRIDAAPDSGQHAMPSAEIPFKTSLYAKNNVSLSADNGFATTINADDEPMSAMEQPRGDRHLQDGRNQPATQVSESKDQQLQTSEQNRSTLRVEDLTGSKRFKGKGREDSNRLKSIARAFFKDAQGPICNGNVLEVGMTAHKSKLVTEETLHRSSKKMKTKEGARRRSTMGEAEIAQVTLKRFRISGEANGEGSISDVSNHAEISQRDDEAARRAEAERAQKSVEVKMMDAEGFPNGWKVCVGLRKKGAHTSAKFMKFISPDGREWSSHREALTYAGSTFGINVSTQMGTALEPSEIALTDIAGSNDCTTEVSEPVESRSAAFVVEMDQSGTLGKAICSTCGKAFANQFNLRRHMNRTGHRACDTGSNVFSSESLLKVDAESALVDGIEAFNSGQQEVSVSKQVIGDSFVNSHMKGQSVFPLPSNSLQASGAAVEPMCNDKVKLQEPFEKSDQDGKDVQQETEGCHQGKAVSVEGNAVESENETYECKECQKVFDSQRKHRSHLRIHSPRRSHRGKVKGLECGQCHMVFDRRKRYVSHLSTHSRKSRKQVGRPMGRPAGRPVGRPPKSYRTGKFSDVSVGKKNIVAEDKVGGQKISRGKPSEGSYLCEKCGKVFCDYIRYWGHQSVHSRKTKKRRREPQKHSRRVRTCDDGTHNQGNAVNISLFVCEDCGKTFDEHSRYTGHLSVHSRTRRKISSGAIQPSISRAKPKSISNSVAGHGNDNGTAVYIEKPSSTSVFWRLLADTTEIFVCEDCGKVFHEHSRYTGHLSLHSRTRRKISSGAIQSTISRGKPKSVSNIVAGHANDNGTAIYNEKPLTTSVFWRLLTDTTDKALSGSPATLLFEGNVNTSGLTKQEEEREEEKTPLLTSPNDSIQTSQIAVMEGASTTMGLSQHEENTLLLMQDMSQVGWSTYGCSICRHIGGDNVQRVVCNWCDKEFHWSCLMEGFLVTSVTWVCPSCKTASRSLQR